MKILRKVNLMFALLAVIAALTAVMAGPVHAGGTPCGSAQAAAGTTNDDVIATSGWCIIGPEHTVNGNVISMSPDPTDVEGTVIAGLIA